LKCPPEKKECRLFIIYNVKLIMKNSIFLFLAIISQKSTKIRMSKREKDILEIKYFKNSILDFIEKYI